MKKFLFVYLMMFFLFVGTFIMISEKQNNLAAIDQYVQKTTFGDMALATDFVDIRFYSLGNMQQIYDDPLLGEKSFLGFVYRKKDE